MSDTGTRAKVAAEAEMDARLRLIKIPEPMRFPGCPRCDEATYAVEWDGHVWVDRLTDHQQKMVYRLIDKLIQEKADAVEAGAR